MTSSLQHASTTSTRRLCVSSPINTPRGSLHDKHTISSLSLLTLTVRVSQLTTLNTDNPDSTCTVLDKSNKPKNWCNIGALPRSFLRSLSITVTGFNELVPCIRVRRLWRFLATQLRIQGDASQLETVSCTTRAPTCQHPKRPGGLQVLCLGEQQPMEPW